MNLSLQHLRKAYNQRTILNNICSDFTDNTITGLLGVNGAGKSTLIKSILGLINPDQGNIALNGKPIKPGDISYLPEVSCLPSTLSAWQLLNFATRNKPRETERLLRQVALNEESWHRKTNEYSKGMRQRTSIAFTLASRAKWLILDEPMSGLDALGRRHMLDVFSDFHNNGGSILICSHQVADLVRICHKIVLISHGEIAETFTITEHSIAEVEIIESRLALHERNKVCIE
ncbi:MAG: ABC transporter ATP-binding protein [Zetaproteobacteria bacterium CG_4_9_14_3_um_filter_49_83]|nr:MAG: hypothetical protein AUJ56_03510 [Zetaproteobacteria bacterium CG1_02_49_23]PIQ34693.1 MAG: ABC transporter ATP-binding protein [Zetaproteobacteria bacterium CG17_big_fil_post_rev_8_21_14_2_50_50_13]PIV30007.1 MAG: ABC transporter ATP-binding protein [Zetaproteobacteria bacterium CG02_land_8_20_14_3_00_50_9]PIY54988.1 MAG: ABC transporter ATP-binding protein [Zetaproteobacteria bacterium CG_4_10_14_0_8_um_filter_49_80]PJA34276.1 MAG: ABC transporter ATP-binding protein [Zetaproteobacter